LITIWKCIPPLPWQTKERLQPPSPHHPFCCPWLQFKAEGLLKDVKWKKMFEKDAGKRNLFAG